MRLLARALLCFMGVVLAVVLCAPAFSAEEFSFRRCPDGSYARAGETGTRCPKVVTLVSVSSITSTGATVTINTEGTDGSIYIYLSTASTARTWQTVRSGSSATKHSGAIAVTAAGNYSYSFTGLTSSTPYYGWAVYVPAAGRASRVLPITFSTTDGSTPGSTLTGRFIDCNAAAGGNGTTSALSGANGAWDSIEDLEANQGGLAAGTDIWIRAEGCDYGYDTDASGWLITHGGVDSTNHAIIGGYYLDPGNSNTPTAVWEGSLGGRLQWLEDQPGYGKIGPDGSETLEPWYITGAVTQQQLDDGTAHYTGGFMADCASPHGVLLHMTGDYVTLRGGHIRRSSCGGGFAWDTSAGGGVAEDKQREFFLYDMMFAKTGQQTWISNVGQRNAFWSHVVSDGATSCANAWQRGKLSAAQFTIAFTSGGTTEIERGDFLRGATSNKRLRVQEITVTSGSWAAGTAAGTLYVTESSGSGDMTAGETVNRDGPSTQPTVTNIATLTTSTATTGGVTHVLRPMADGLRTQCGMAGGSGAGPLGTARGGGWSTGIAIARSLRSYSTVEALGSYNSGGECIAFYMGSHVTVRGAVGANCLSYAIYPDGFSNLLVDGLLSHDNGKYALYPNNALFGTGLVFGYEDIATSSLLGDNQSNVVRNSIFANGDATGGVFGVQWQSTHHRTGPRPRKIGFHLLNNAFPALANRAMTEDSLVDTATSGVYISNNWIDESSSALTSQCRSDAVTTNNLFTKTASNTEFNRCKDATDVNNSAATDPQVARNPYNNTANRDHWRGRGVVNGLIDPDDAKPVTGSPLINAGSATWASTVCVDNHTSYDRTWALSTYPYALDTPTKRANFAKCRYYDRDGVAATSNVDIGPFESQGTAPAEDLQPVMTVSANGRYLRKNGNPWMWVGCTGWRIKTITSAKVTEWLEAEAARGCQVAVAGSPAQTDDAWPPYVSTDPFCNAGETTGCDTNTSNPRMRTSFYSGVGNLDHFVSETKRLGMFAAIPATFGSAADRFLCEDGWATEAPSCSTTTRATNYATWLATRYAAEKHVIWIASGEYSKIGWTVNPTTHAVTQNTSALTTGQLAVLNAAATALQANAHASTLVTTHPDSGYYTEAPGKGSSRGHFSNETWLNFSMLQAGYNDVSRVNTERDYGLTPVMPVVQGELNYESTDVNDPEDSPWHVRMGAWTHVLSGGAGYTYGHTAIWDFNTGWEEYLPGGATPAVGADDIYTHFRTFWETYHDETNVPARELITSGGGSSAFGTDTYLSVLRKGDYTTVIAYAPKGSTFSLNTNLLQGSIRARWFNPRTGAYTAISDPLTKSASTSFDPPNTPAVDNDWVLVLD